MTSFEYTLLGEYINTDNSEMSAAEAQDIVKLTLSLLEQLNV